MKPNSTEVPRFSGVPPGQKRLQRSSAEKAADCQLGLSCPAGQSGQVKKELLRREGGRDKVSR